MMQANPWFNPQMNPRGNWQATVDTFKSMGLLNVEDYMPPKPPVPPGDASLVDKLWQQFSHGDTPEVDSKQDNMMIMQALAKRIQTDYMLLSPEYRPNVDTYMINLRVAAMQQLKDAQEQQIAQALAAQTIHQINNGQGVQPGQADQSGKVFTPLPAANINQPTGVESVGGPNAGAAAGDRRYENVPASGEE